VEQDADERTWRGSVTDSEIGWWQKLGAWRILEGQKGIQNHHLGFLEWWLGLEDCSRLPYSRVTYGRPYSTRPDRVDGFRVDPREADKPCMGSTGFSWVRNPGGSITAEAGFRNPTVISSARRKLTRLHRDGRPRRGHWHHHRQRNPSRADPVRIAARCRMSEEQVGAAQRADTEGVFTRMGRADRVPERPAVVFSGVIAQR